MLFIRFVSLMAFCPCIGHANESLPESPPDERDAATSELNRSVNSLSIGCSHRALPELDARIKPLRTLLFDSLDRTSLREKLYGIGQSLSASYDMS